jgi:small subunit ribosomal protein S18
MIVKRDCKLCMDQIVIDYKQADLLKKFMTERGRILPRRISGNCARHQRQLARAIKRARTMLLVR